MSYTLAVDFGTSFTAAAVAVHGGQPVLLDLAGDGSQRIPSAVALSAEGTWLVGKVALGEALLAPERFERAPKRLVGQEEGVLLGERDVPVSDLIAAVLRHVRHVAITQRGEPAFVRLTYPASWQRGRQDVLRAAATQAGYDADPERFDLLQEPVAAAVSIADAGIRDGDRVAVYDLGGGTFDAAVLQRVNGGFELVGPPGGLEAVGGDSFDQLIFEELSRSRLAERPEWAHLTFPQDERWLRARTQLLTSIQEAKERLSTASTAHIWVPELNEDYQITRTEFNRLIRRDVEQTGEVLVRTIIEANVRPMELAGVFIVGASSRIPLVSDTIWRRLSLQPETREDPKAVVSLGATRWLSGGASHRSHKGEPPRPDPPGATAAAGEKASAGPTDEPPEPPTVARQPRLKGFGRVGHELRVTRATFSGEKPISLRYQWERRQDDSVQAIASAQGQSYSLTVDDVGTALRARITAAGPGGTVVATTRWSRRVSRGRAGTRAFALPLGALMLALGLIVAVIALTSGSKQAATHLSSRSHSASHNRAAVGTPPGAEDVVSSVTIPVAKPLSIAVQNGTVWVTTEPDTVMRIDVRSGKVMPAGIPVGAGILHPLAYGEGSIWVANDAENTVTRIEAGSGSVIGNPIVVGKTPIGIAVAQGSVWVANQADNTVTRIDSRSGRVIGNPTKVGQYPTGVAVGQGRVWVTNQNDNTVSQIDARSGTVIGNPIPVGAGPSGVIVADGSVWVTNTTDYSVTRINAATGKVTGGSISVGAGASLPIAYGQGSVWVANDEDNTVTRIDSRSGRVIDKAIRVGKNPSGVAVSQNSVWITNQDDKTVTRLSLSRAIGG